MITKIISYGIAGVQYDLRCSESGFETEHETVKDDDNDVGGGGRVNPRT